MGHRFLELLTTPSVREARAANRSAETYARVEGGPDHHDRIGPDEAIFLSARDSFYLASVSEAGWPYLQHRGGPAGFLKVLDERTLGFADYRGNRQYLTLGNIAADDRVALLVMDYPSRRRLKLLGRLRAHEPAASAELATRVVDGEYGARVERIFTVAVEAFDWNCPQHITPRFSKGELADALEPIRARITELEAENAALRMQLRTGLSPRP